MLPLVERSLSETEQMPTAPVEQVQVALVPIRISQQTMPAEIATLKVARPAEQVVPQVADLRARAVAPAVDQAVMTAEAMPPQDKGTARPAERPTVRSTPTADRHSLIQAP
jgi:hypothetical protein